MALSPGDRLGPYEIAAVLGDGGMGEVYKARDTRLDRTVALKVSKAQFTDRFEREARAVAALNHPNICQLYDVGPNYLVMEFVDGEELKGPLPLEKALEISYQILDALDAAHKQGITHRDLKPANLIVAKQGIKLLDFGLAKQEVRIAPTDATLTKALTSEGQLLGTLQYMSPEQAQRQNADARSDIFAFGCVFHELITGKRAFNGENVAAVIAAILKDEPAARHLPEAVDRVIKTCLAKDADARFQSAADCKRALQWATEAKRYQAKKDWLWPSVAAAALAVLALLFWPKQSGVSGNPISFHVLPPEGYSFEGTTTISPNGEFITFHARGAKSDRSIWVHSLRDVQSVLVPGSERATTPVWARDSKHIAFLVDGKIMRASPDGSPAEVVGTGPRTNMTALVADGSFLFSAVSGPVARVTGDGSAERPLLELDSANRETSQRAPQMLADGDRFLFRSVGESNAHRGFFVGSIKSGKVIGELRGVSDSARITGFRYCGGYLFLQREETIVAYRVDESNLSVAGGPILVSSVREPFPALSLSGMMVRRPISSAAVEDLAETDRRGQVLRRLASGSIGHPELSADGTQLFYDLNDRRMGRYQSMALDLSRGVSARLSLSEGSMNIPIQSPDGKTIYVNNSNGIAAFSASGSGDLKQIFKGPSHHQHISPDGKFLYFERVMNANRVGISSLALDGSEKVSDVLPPDRVQMDPQFSPDGKWFAYDSDETGERAVYIQSVPLGRGKFRISTKGGVMPRFRGDGKELYYAEPETENLFAVDLALKETVRAGPPRLLFKLKYRGRTFSLLRYAVSAGGQRFYYPVVSDLRIASIEPLLVVQSWPATVRPSN